MPRPVVAVACGGEHTAAITQAAAAAAADSGGSAPQLYMWGRCSSR